MAISSSAYETEKLRSLVVLYFFARSVPLFLVSLVLPLIDNSTRNTKWSTMAVRLHPSESTVRRILCARVVESGVFRFLIGTNFYVYFDIGSVVLRRYTVLDHKSFGKLTSSLSLSEYRNRSAMVFVDHS